MEPPVTQLDKKGPPTNGVSHWEYTKSSKFWWSFRKRLDQTSPSEGTTVAETLVSKFRCVEEGLNVLASKNPRWSRSPLGTWELNREGWWKSYHSQLYKNAWFLLFLSNLPK